MKIGVQSQPLTDRNLCGIGYYVFNLLDALVRLDNENEYILFSKKKLIYQPTRGNVSSHVLGPPFAFTYLGFPLGLKKSRCDLAFIPMPKVPLLADIPQVVTVHDLYYQKSKGEFKPEIPTLDKINYFLAAKFHLKKATKILTVSEYTKKCVVELCSIDPDIITVAPLGYEKELFRPQSREEIEKVLIKYDLDQPYFINVSSLWWARKNLGNLIEAFYRYTSKNLLNSTLVIVGNRGPSYPKMLRLISKRKLNEKVKLLEYIPRKDLPCLLGGAEALIFPSLHEGFGLPIIEAMACGCPVVTSNNSAMIEVAKDAAVLVDPLDISSIEKGMRRIVEYSSQKERLVERGLKRAKFFSWEKTAKITLEVINSFF